MKEPRYRAWINWLSPKNGGRDTIPSGPFRIDVRFDEQKNWPAEGWTLVVRPVRHSSDRRLQVAKVDFLVAEAPHDLMVSGARFDLFDGMALIAHGLVVDADEDGTISRHAAEELLLV